MNTNIFCKLDTNWYLCIMRQPEITKLYLLEQSGNLFNVKGYKATSISDITSATGLTKGAIYRHFTNKEDLEGESLGYMFNVVKEKLGKLLKNENTAPKKLFAIFKFFESYANKPIIKGGCPLLNASIEADDTSPLLRKKAIQMLNILKMSISKILQNGVKYGQIKSDTNIELLTTIIFCALEGGIMSSRLTKNSKDIKLVIKHLTSQVEAITL
jgi:TetR/AcrR family transcriptional regulator, transcriptional repressor for nem operon